MVKVRDLQIKKMLMLTAGILLFMGCVPERKLGSEYLSQRKDITVVLRAPEFVKMVNLTPDSVTDNSDLSTREKDSIKFYQSKILQNVTDSILIGNYIRSLKTGFERQGYHTMIAYGNDSVYAVKGDAILINIGQIQLDEQKYPYRDETQYQGKLYAADYDLSKIELSFWLEVSKIDNGIAVQPPRLLYDSYDKTEDFEGDFALNPKTNFMNYISNKAEITPQYIDSVANVIGRDHASRLNDFMMNEYISYYLPQKKNRVLFGVDQNFGTLFRIYEPSFKEIHE